MTYRVPSEPAIKAEMERAGVTRMVAIRRIQSRATINAHERIKRAQCAGMVRL